MKNYNCKVSVHEKNSEQQSSQFSSNISRRHFIKNSFTVLAAPLLFGCSELPTQKLVDPRLEARPRTDIPALLPTRGYSELGLGDDKDGFLYIPYSYTGDKAMPLFIAMHGAGGSSSNWRSYTSIAESRGMILLAPDSRARTWDLIWDDYGEDLEFLDLALQYVFEYCNIDTQRILLGGFSDGASYALSLGLSNGDLFSHLLGLSPGFLVRTSPIVGDPQIYVAHGTRDTTLPVESSRDRIVPSLLNSGYDVTYNEFDGGHTITSNVFNTALDWFMD